MSEFTVNNSGEDVVVSLADLAGINMDDVEEYEGGFILTPKGAYEFNCTNAELTEIADSPVIKFTCEIIGCTAIASDEHSPESIIGAIHEENFFIKDVQKTIGSAKRFMRIAGSPVMSGSLTDLLDGFCGTKFFGKIKHRPKKNDPETIYANLDMKSVKPVA